jgi:hypothetical protein
MLLRYEITVPLNIIKHLCTIVMSHELDGRIVRLCDLIILNIETLLSGSTEIWVDACANILCNTARKLFLGKSHIDIGIKEESRSTMIRIHNLLQKHKILMERVPELKLFQ